MIGTVLRIRYELLQSLHDGAIFTLYLAKDRVHGKDVFIRVLKPPFDREPEFVEALKKAVAKAAGVQHPGVERNLEVDEDDGTIFVVGEASSGVPLAERIKRLAPFSVPVSVSTAISICEALSSVHSTFIVHGDIGPHHMYVSPEGDVRLQMTGIWDAYSGSSTAGSVVLPSMSPYLAPEVSRGGIPSPGSDIYGVGVILFELLAGRKPYVADYPVAMAMMHASEPTPEVRTLNPSVPMALNEIVKKAMAKDPTERYRSAGDMLSDLRMVRDALRFGKSLTWPLSGPATGEKEPEPAAPVPKKGSSAKQDGDQWVEDIDDEPADIPSWLKMTMVFFGALVVFMVGGWILFNLSKPKTVLVPTLQRLTVSEAKDKLERLGLTMRVAQRIPNEDFPADTVIDSSPSAGAKVYEKNSVSLTISAGSRFVEVPDLRGLPVDRAKAMLDTVGLRLDETVVQERNRDVEAGLIISHVPERRTRVERNTRIRVTVSTGNQRVTQPSDNDRKYLYTVSIRLSDINEPVSLRVDLTDTRGTRTVHESMQGPGDEVQITAEGYGDEVVFRIFYDGELVKQVTKNANENEGTERIDE